MELMNESCENVGSGTLFDQKYIDLWREKSKDPNGVNENGVPNYIAYPNTNWLKELYSGGNITFQSQEDLTKFVSYCQPAIRIMKVL